MSEITEASHMSSIQNIANTWAYFLTNLSLIYKDVAKQSPMMWTHVSPSNPVISQN